MAPNYLVGAWLAAVLPQPDLDSDGGGAVTVQIAINQGDNRTSNVTASQASTGASRLFYY